jgi:hypothetical protein
MTQEEVVSSTPENLMEKKEQRIPPQQIELNEEDTHLHDFDDLCTQASEILEAAF